MKQLQSQMEAEMRMKTELVRHQMQILSEVQSDSDFNEVISRFAGKEIILKMTQNVAFKFSNFGLLIFQLQKSVSCPSRRHFSRLSMRGNSLRSSRPANSMDQDSFDSFDDIEEMVMATTSMSIGHNGHSDANRFVKILKVQFFCRKRSIFT